MGKKMVNINDRYVKVQNRIFWLATSFKLLALGTVLTGFIMGCADNLSILKLFVIAAITFGCIFLGRFYDKKLDDNEGKANQGDRI